MSDQFRDAEAARLGLSALVDGEASPHEVARACAQWRDDPEVRANWHRFQLIGDLMRSEDLARTSPGDVFLQNFRERLAQEPVALAPAAAESVVALALARPPLAEPLSLRKRVWSGPLSVAAVFVLGVGLVINSPILPGGAPSEGVPLAQSAQPIHVADGGVQPVDLSSALVPLTPSLQAASAQVSEGVVSTGSSFSRPATVDAVMVHDPQVDALLRARHDEARAESFSGQSGLLQQVAFSGP